MLDARFSHLYFYQSLNRLQRGLSAIAELLVLTHTVCPSVNFFLDISHPGQFIPGTTLLRPEEFLPRHFPSPENPHAGIAERHSQWTACYLTYLCEQGGRLAEW